MPKSHADELPDPTPVELNRIVSLAEASRLSSLSVDTLRDQFPEKIVQLSPKRAGNSMYDALFLHKKSALRIRSEAETRVR